MLTAGTENLIAAAAAIIMDALNMERIADSRTGSNNSAESSF